MAMYSFYAVPLYLIALMVLFYTSHENAVMCVVSGAQQRYESWGDEWLKAMSRVAEGHEGVGRGEAVSPSPLGVGSGEWAVTPPPENFANFCLATVHFGTF